ncbi:MAG TPA: hypothetical protein VFR44_15495 [Actinomycetota bacterium]|nr:hypothetical protein [Actinomycetota bacterium]
MPRAILVLPVAVLVLAACSGGGADRTTTPRATDVTVDTREVAVRTFNGFGAEWDPYEHSPTSAVPQLVKDRIAFMRLSFVRVRMVISWYSDVNDEGVTEYDFSSAAMQPLYDILDATKANGTDVVLTEWDRTSGEDPWPMNDPRYAEAVAEGLDHLINSLGYTNIRYVVIGNEPDIFGPVYERWSTAIINLHRQLAARDLLDAVRVMGPDICCTDGWWERSLLDLNQQITAWDRHRYPDPEDVRSGVTESFLRLVWDQARASDPNWSAKPFVLGEAGFQSLDQSTHGYATDMADYAIQATRAGTSMMSAWMLDDESYPDGLDTDAPTFYGMWSNRDSGSALKPWFYTWSLLSRLVRPGSTLYLATQPPNIRALAARHPSTGTWTFVLVNREPTLAQDVTVKVPGSGTVTYDRYLFDGNDGSGPRDANGFPLPVTSGQAGNLNSGITLSIPANSVAYITVEPA